MGVLEAEVLAALSAAGRPLSPQELLDGLGDADLAYSTVTTVLTRLAAKGLVVRERAGRHYAYRLAVDEAQVVAGQMYDRLARSGDRSGVLRQFVTELGADDAVALRALLQELDRTATSGDSASSDDDDSDSDGAAR
jgi:predicted transcriptional regulator